MATIWSSSSARMSADNATPACCTHTDTSLSKSMHVFEVACSVADSLCSHLIIFGSEHLDDLISHELMTMYLSADSNNKDKVVLFECLFDVTSVSHYTTSALPSSVWRSPEQRSTSRRACISSALDPLWRREQCHFHNENLRREKYVKFNDN